MCPSRGEPRPASNLPKEEAGICVCMRVRGRKREREREKEGKEKREWGEREKVFDECESERAHGWV